MYGQYYFFHRNLDCVDDFIELAFFLIRVPDSWYTERIRLDTKRSDLMKYVKSHMQQLVKENPVLHQRLNEIMKEHDLEKSLALKALYHAEVAAGGKFQEAYRALQ